MIDLFGQIMIYVDDPHEVANFWVDKVGFVKLGEGDGAGPDENGARWAEVSPTKTSDTAMVFFDRKVIAKLDPELDLATPSILFSTYDLEKTLDEFHEKGITTGEIVEMMGMRSFNFSDNEGNYFAIREVSPTEKR